MATNYLIIILIIYSEGIDNTTNYEKWVKTLPTFDFNFEIKSFELYYLFKLNLVAVKIMAWNFNMTLYEIIFSLPM